MSSTGGDPVQCGADKSDIYKTNFHSGFASVTAYGSVKDGGTFNLTWAANEGPNGETYQNPQKGVIDFGVALPYSWFNTSLNGTCSDGLTAKNKVYRPRDKNNNELCWEVFAVDQTGQQEGETYTVQATETCGGNCGPCKNGEPDCMTGWCDADGYPPNNPVCWGKQGQEGKTCCDQNQGTWYDYVNPYLDKNRCCPGQQASFQNTGPTITGAGDQSKLCDTNQYYPSEPGNTQTDWCQRIFAHMDVGATPDVMNDTLCKGKNQPCIIGYRRIACPAPPPTPIPAPIPMLLWCPECKTRHIDIGEFAINPHHTHACQHCGFVWRPAVIATVGVHYLPGFQNADPKTNS